VAHWFWSFVVGVCRTVKMGGLMAFVSLFVGACSPGYVLQAAFQQSKILLGRRQIEQVILDPDTPQEEREKLRVVLQARAFASELGLTTGRSFTSYSDIGKDTLAWIVVASRKDSFALYQWWFPIVGTVPYKGFFDEKDAIAQGEQLETQGYECSIRGTEAFSTLGWFNDPVLSTTLKNPPSRIANTVIHESVHSTVWIQGNVAFNESLANFVGMQGAIEFFTRQRDECLRSNVTCEVVEERLRAANRDKTFQLDFGDTVTEVIARLEALYSSADLTSEQKIARRQEVFATAIAPFQSKYPKVSVLRQVNNAEIVQYRLYLTQLRRFERLFLQSSGSWSTFWDAIREIRNAVEKDSSQDPFALLEAITEKSA
jgi:predicted aminopeptidase